MLKNEEIEYIQKYMPKSGEQLDYSFSDAPLIDIRIVKQTERTYSITGLITLVNSYIEETGTVDEELLKLKLIPKKKIQLGAHHPKTIK